ncbi:MAG: PQQ-binding-like beta-propeller repeat protein [Candidatus Hydrogenedentes bacterium]|nr:PQQ-binding-like beta-propeller repeat protein [Candidatus Hydrogenedentota bacterium]
MDNLILRRCRSQFIVMSLFLLLPALAVKAELSLPVLWQTDLQTYTESGASVADVTGDGTAEIVIVGRDEIIALDGMGKEMWRYKTRGRNMTYPSVVPRPGQPALIFSADTSGQMTCLDGTGQVVWQKDLKGPSSWSASVVCDLESDGALEIVQTDETGAVWVFDALNGNVRWQVVVKGMPVSPAVADIDGDGKAEIAIVTGAGELTVLDATGKAKWTNSIGGTSQTWGSCAPVMFRSSDGAGRVLAASNEGECFCFDALGKLVWKQPTKGAVASGISVGDMDADGIVDVFVVTQTGVLHRFDEMGKALWSMDTQGRSLAAGALIDMTGDGLLEYVLATQSGHLMVFDGSAALLFDRQFPHRTINVTPAFGDVSPTTPRLEMVITGGEAGLVYCFGTGANSDSRATWRAYRGDEYKSGAWIGNVKKTGSVAVREAAAPSSSVQSANDLVAPPDLSADGVVAGESVRLTITNPGVTPVVAVATCSGPDGFVQGAITRVFGKHGELRLPVEVSVEGLYRFSWTLMNEDGSTLAKGASDLTLKPFANERRLADEASKALDETVAKLDSTNPLIAESLRRERASLRDEVSASIPDYARLAARPKWALRLCDLANGAAALGATTSLLPFENALWENRVLNKRLPEKAVATLQIARRTTLGEHEPVSVGLFNPLGRDIQARIALEVPKGGPAVTVLQSVPTVTSIGETSWDALPELIEPSIVTVPSMETSEVWLDIDTRDMQPGAYPITMRVLALNGAGVDVPRSPQAMPPPETKVEIALTVLPFELAPPGSVRLCAWAQLNPGCVEDMLEHGNNVFVGPHATPQLDAQGKLTGIDFSALDTFLEPLTGHDVVVLLSGMPSLKGEAGTPEYLAQLGSYLDGLVPHLAEKGLGMDSFAMYPVDEPAIYGWDTTNRYVAFAKAVKTLRPEIMVYMDGGGEVPLFEAMAPYTDIWCPGISMLAEDSPAMRIVRKDAKHLWSYDCAYAYSRPSGPNIKNVNIVGQFRTAALFAFRHGATGIGYWSYNIGEDLWGRAQMEYPLVYSGKVKPITSRRWEAVREGIEDYRLLFALRSRIDDAAPDRVPEPIRAKIEHLLNVSLPAMIDPAYEEVRVGLGRDALDYSNNDGTIRAFRDELLDCAESVVGIEAKDVSAP